MSYVDRKVGDLLATLSEANLARETIVIFVSDHGDMLCEKAMVQKRSSYEWSSRIALIVLFPDGRHQGVKVRDHVSLIDVAPTVLDWAGVEERMPMDGASLMPLLEHPTSVQRRTVIGEMHCEGVQAPCSMVRQGNYKYVYVPGADEQWFDLTQDPGEWTDLSRDLAYGHIAQDLRTDVLARFDPARIRHDLRASLSQRKLIRPAMKRNGADWEYRVGRR